MFFSDNDCSCFYHQYCGLIKNLKWLVALAVCLFKSARLWFSPTVLFCGGIMVHINSAGLICPPKVAILRTLLTAGLAGAVVGGVVQGCRRIGVLADTAAQTPRGAPAPRHRFTFTAARSPRGTSPCKPIRRELESSCGFL